MFYRFPAGCCGGEGCGCGEFEGDFGIRFAGGCRWTLEAFGTLIQMGVAAAAMRVGCGGGFLVVVYVLWWCGLW